MTKTDIILKASLIIACEGYDRLTMSTLADALKIKKASIYYHFKSKEEIIEALYDYFEKDCLHLGFSIDLSKEPEEILSTALSHWMAIFEDRERGNFISLIEQRKEIDGRAAELSHRFFLMLQGQSEAIMENLAEKRRLKTNNPKLLSTLFALSIHSALINESADASTLLSDFCYTFLQP